MIFKYADPRAKIRKKSTHPESEVQMECVALIQDYEMTDRRTKIKYTVEAKYREHKFFCYSIPNERPTSAFVGWLFNRMGRKKGMCDFCIVEKDKHIYFEFKSEDGKTSPEQKKVHTELIERGNEVYVVDNIEDFERIVLLIIKRRE